VPKRAPRSVKKPPLKAVAEATEAKIVGTSRRKPRQSASAIAAAASGDLQQKALRIAAVGLDKKALDIEILDVTGRVDYADYLVLMTGTSDRHVAGIVQGIEGELLRAGNKALSVEGLPTANWVLVDFGDIVVHVFQESARDLYDLDGLWMDAGHVPVPVR